MTFSALFCQHLIHLALKFFAKSIDRIKINENTILINPVEEFLVCYVIKGQSYPALQKLSRFSDAIKWKTEIWDTLRNSIKTSIKNRKKY